MIGNSRAAVGLHERVGFRTGVVALLPTDPAQQEAKRATVTRVGVIAFERPGGAWFMRGANPGDGESAAHDEHISDQPC
jgi:hypothetical protein